MKDFQEFLAMGGYAFYVWSAYGVTFIVLLANLLMPILHGRRLERELAHRHDTQVDQSP